MKFQAALSGLLIALSSTSVFAAETETGILTTVKSPMDMAETLVDGLRGITVTDARMVGKEGCAATFSGGKKAVPEGFPDEGVVISTGYPASLHMQTTDRLSTIHNKEGDADLDAIVAGSTLDACALEFDFTCEHEPCPIMFDYVFGSEEYTEYVNNNISPDDLTYNYNDVFAWFLNGQNIATIKETGEAVSIDTINDEFNTKYFINNDPSVGVIYPNMEADGFTTLMQAFGVAKGDGKTNTMKLVIADRQDMMMDSWGLFKAKSFKYSPPAGGGGGDPHFQRWSIHARDTFHGECDLVILNAPHFHNDQGLDIHVRTTMESFFSYIESAAVRIGEHTVEVNNGHVLVNGKKYKDADLPVSFGDYKLSTKDVQGKNRRKYGLYLDEESELEFRFYKEYMTFNVVGHPDFKDASGMLGKYPTGEMIARDGKVMTDFVDFGFEWQVNPGMEDPQIFSNLRSPQLPYEACRIPTMAQPSRRKLRGASQKLFAKANEACASVEGKNFDLCLDDVMMTGDIELAGEWM